MHIARKILFGSALTISILACGLGSTPAIPTGNNVATVVASTLQALTPVAPASTATSQPTLQGIPVNYKNVSFTIPTGLATDAAPQTMPQTTEDNGGPWGAGPEHLEFRLDGYNVPANGFSVLKIDVYPADAYANANAGANIALQRLKGILGNPSASLTNETLPQVPDFNAASMIAAQVRRVEFQNGRGVRLISQYGQAVGPIANYGTFYHFQGLTNDGKYFIIAVLPVQATILQKGNEPNAGLPAGGIPFPGYENMGNQKVYDDYFAAVTDKLNATPDDQFSPSLATLDALVQSFSVSP